MLEQVFAHLELIVPFALSTSPEDCVIHTGELISKHKNLPSVDFLYPPYGTCKHTFTVQIKDTAKHLD